MFPDSNGDARVAIQPYSYYDSTDQLSSLVEQCKTGGLTGAEFYRCIAPDIQQTLTAEKIPFKDDLMQQEDNQTLAQSLLWHKLYWSWPHLAPLSWPHYHQSYWSWPHWWKSSWPHYTGLSWPGHIRWWTWGHSSRLSWHHKPYWSWSHKYFWSWPHQWYWSWPHWWQWSWHHAKWWSWRPFPLKKVFRIDDPKLCNLVNVVYRIPLDSSSGSSTILASNFTGQTILKFVLSHPNLTSVIVNPPYTATISEVEKGKFEIKLSPSVVNNGGISIEVEYLTNTGDNNTAPMEVSLGDVQCLEADLSSFEATQENGEVSLTWKIKEQNNAGVNIWKARVSNGQVKEVTRLNNKIIPTETEGFSVAPVTYSRKYPLQVSDDEVNYFILEDVSYDGLCTIHCDHIEALTAKGDSKKSNTDLKAAEAFCKQYVETQLMSTFGEKGSCLGTTY